MRKIARACRQLKTAHHRLLALQVGGDSTDPGSPSANEALQQTLSTSFEATEKQSGGMSGELDGMPLHATTTTAAAADDFTNNEYGDGGQQGDGDMAEESMPPAVQAFEDRKRKLTEGLATDARRLMDCFKVCVSAAPVPSFMCLTGLHTCVATMRKLIRQILCTSLSQCSHCQAFSPGAATPLDEMLNESYHEAEHVIALRKAGLVHDIRQMDREQEEVSVC